MALTKYTSHKQKYISNQQKESRRKYSVAAFQKMNIKRNQLLKKNVFSWVFWHPFVNIHSSFRHFQIKQIICNLALTWKGIMSDCDWLFRGIGSAHHFLLWGSLLLLLSVQGLVKLTFDCNLIRGYPSPWNTNSAERWDHGIKRVH